MTITARGVKQGIDNHQCRRENGWKSKYGSGIDSSSCPGISASVHHHRVKAPRIGH